jgi:hypothetical protein
MGRIIERKGANKAKQKEHSRTTMVQPSNPSGTLPNLAFNGVRDEKRGEFKDIKLGNCGET